MYAPIRLRTSVAAASIAAVGITAAAAAPPSPLTQTLSPSTASFESSLTASEVPLGGLITTFLRNQATYCSIICPLLVQTGTTGLTAALGAPTIFFTALQSGDILEAIGVAAASVTGPTNSAASAAIFADGAEVAPRALNAFEVGVVGLLNIAPAAGGGLPGIVDAIQTARQDTFTALNLPIVPSPTPTVMPHGVVQVTVIAGINVIAAVIFPAFNDILGAAFSAPDTAAQELAATGDPVKAIAAGAASAAASMNAAVAVVADAVSTGISDIRAAASVGNPTPKTQKISPATISAQADAKMSRRSVAADVPSRATPKVRSTPRSAGKGVTHPSPRHSHAAS